jgi:Flp pilus assembly protein TadG
MRPSRSSGRATLTRERRGSIIVWAGALAVVLVAFGAIAVDFGNFYAIANETQLTVDAAALSGAQRYQRSTSDNRLADAQASARFVANKNRVMGDTATVQNANVKLVHWREATGEVLDVDATAPANAVQVVDTAQTQFVFGYVLYNQFARVAPPIRRGAVAWMANVSGATCIKPLGFSMSMVYRMLGASPADGPLTQEQVDRFNKLSEADRTFISNPAPNGVGTASVDVPLPYDRYAGLALTGQGGGVPEYQKYLSGVACQTLANAVDVNDVYDQPSAQNAVQTTEIFTGTAQGNPARDYPAICRFATAINETCYDPSTGAVGVTNPSVFGVVPGQFGRSNFKVNMLADVTFVCYIRGNNKGEPRNNASCANTKFDVTKYSEGTIVGIVQPNLSFLAGQLTYSDVPSISQRLILVK